MGLWPINARAKGEYLYKDKIFQDKMNIRMLGLALSVYGPEKRGAIAEHRR